MRIRYAFAGALTAGLALITAATPANAQATASGQPTAKGQPTARGLTWEPYRTQPFTSPAGQSCAFPLKGEPVHDEEQIATLATFPDGTPKQQIIRGDLRVRYTNLDTGAAVEKDLNGVGYLEYETTGASTFHLFGPAAVGFRPTDPYPPGFYALDGYHVIYTAPGRAFREMKVDAGTEHNICADID
jgi:hypothetical protein